jgi:DNA-binding GntR family transcriptional regulator
MLTVIEVLRHHVDTVYTQRIHLLTTKTSGLTSRAYEQLREEIVQGTLLSGEPLYEIHLADRLGMSRTPVREALKLLTRDGYLHELPSRGYAVPYRSLDDLREFFELREVLEASATRYAALRATPAEIAQLERLCVHYEREKNNAKWVQFGHDFHSLLIKAARNSRLETMLDSLNAQIVMSRRTVAQADPVRRQAAVRDHRAIFEAVKARDDARAQTLAAEHVRRSYETTLRAHVPAAFSVQLAA